MTLAALVETFNYPNEMGEYAADSYRDLREAVPQLPAADRAAGEALLAEMARMVDGEVGEGEGTPYTVARLREGVLELFHSGRSVWVTHVERDALRTAPAAAGDGLAAARVLVAGFPPPGDEPDRRFEERTGHRLENVLRTLLDGGDHAAAEATARAALAHGARFPGHWWCVIAESRLERDLLDEPTREAIAQILLRLSGYREVEPTLVYRWYLATGADDELLRLVHHGLRTYCDRIGLRPPRGPKPSRLRSRFGALYAEWIEAAWPGVEAFDAGTLMHLRSLFETLGGRSLQKRRGEIDARLAVLLRR